MRYFGNVFRTRSYIVCDRCVRCSTTYRVRATASIHPQYPLFLPNDPHSLTKPGDLTRLSPDYKPQLHLQEYHSIILCNNAYQQQHRQQRRNLLVSQHTPTICRTQTLYSPTTPVRNAVSQRDPRPTEAKFSRPIYNTYVHPTTRLTCAWRKPSPKTNHA